MKKLKPLVPPLDPACPKQQALGVHGPFDWDKMLEQADRSSFWGLKRKGENHD